MGGSRLDEQSNDSGSSDTEDLPVYDFLQSRSSQTGHGWAGVTDLVILDSSDSETPVPSSPALHRGVGDVMAITSESEEEAEASLPLALRLKRRLAGPVASTVAVCTAQPRQTATNHRGVRSDGASEPENQDGSPCAEAPRAPAASWPLPDRCWPARDGASAPEKQAAKRHPAEVKAPQQEVPRKKAAAAACEKQRADRDLRKLELEKQRAEKKALADAAKALRPEECIKHMVVSVDPALLQLEGGGTLLTSLQALGCSCAIEGLALPRSVAWARRTPAAQPSNQQTGEEQCVAEVHTVVQVPVDDFITMVHSYTQEQRGCTVDCGPTLTAWTLRLLARSRGRTPSLVVIDIEKYFRSQKSQTQKKHREAVLGKETKTAAAARRKRKDGSQPVPEVSRVTVEEALVDLQLHTGVQVHFLQTWKEFSDYIAMSTKAVAEAPFKRERDRTGFSFYLESEWAGGQRVDREGRGLLQVWKRQLQQLNRVSPDIAAALLAAYPSPRLLAQAYRKCRSEPEKHSLLSDVLIRRGEGVTSTTRRVGPELSKRLYLLMTSSDPHQALDSTV